VKYEIKKFYFGKIMRQKISAVGKKLVESGLVEANFGNISVRSSSGNSFIITKTGTALDEIDSDGVIEIPIDNDETDTLVEPVIAAATAEADAAPIISAAASIIAAAIEKAASSETPVHRKIYQETNAKAILHAHCQYSVVISLLEDDAGNCSIIPVDSEGKLFLKEIPIIKGGIGSAELAENAAAAFKDGKTKGIIVLGHGTIAIGATLEEAYNITAQLEHAAKIKYLYAKAKNLF
jgi:L-fuculose-phosphate aldolase